MLHPTVLKNKPGPAEEDTIQADSAPQHYNRGLDLIAAGKKKEAKWELLKASELDKKDSDALCEIGRIEIDEGRLDSAAGFLDDALSRNAGHAEALNNRGVAAFLSGQYAEAAVWFKSAVKSNSELAEAWFNLSDTRGELGDIKGKNEAHLHYLALRKDADGKS